MTTALWWVRRDLRVTDNQALAAALAYAEQVVPVFVLDPALLDVPTAGEKRVAFLFSGLRQLDVDLQARGSRLIVRRGHPAHWQRKWEQAPLLLRRIPGHTPGRGMAVWPRPCL
jgi:deoxyribodipyrimidine photolyase